MCYINCFFIMFYLWNNLSFNSAVFNYWFNDKMKSFRAIQGLQQYVSIFLILSICVVIYSVEYFKTKRQDAFSAEIDPVFIRIATEEEKAAEKENTTVISEQTADVKEEMKQEEKRTVKLIENPLPLPKKHVKKEMNYAFEPSGDQMHYDLNNYSFEDDYDLKDC